VERGGKSAVPNREVVVRFTSGLGNQLFQLACALSTATAWNAQVKADTTWYTIVAPLHRPRRRFRLPILGIALPEAFHGLRRWDLGFAAAAFDRWGRGRQILEWLGSMRVVQERTPMRVQAIKGPSVCERIYLNGYWQTADHFLAVREELQRMIRPTTLMSSGARDWKSRIAQRQTGFIHIRRSDYCSLVGETGLLPLAYYEKAVEYFAGSAWHWLVFSEDEEWARHNIGFLPSWDLVAYQSENRDIEDLLLMASCEGGIIANSSYSWWGAALGDRAQRIIVAPDRYWNREGSGNGEWTLPGWHTVEGWPRT
jgi:hypothetical protein